MALFLGILLLGLLIVVPSLLVLQTVTTVNLQSGGRCTVFGTTLLGVASAYAALAVQHLLRGAVDFASFGPGAGAALQAFGSAALVEETCKFAMLLFFLPRIRNRIDGFVHGAAVSVGFSAVENIWYAYSGGVATAFVRITFPFMMHCVTGICMGHLLGLARERRSWGLAAGSLLVPMLLHGLYDFPLMVRDMWGSGTLVRTEMAWLNVLGWYVLVALLLVLGVVVALGNYRRSCRMRRAQGKSVPRLLDLRRGTLLGAPRGRMAWGVFLFGLFLVILGFALSVYLLSGLGRVLHNPFHFGRAVDTMVVAGLLPLFLGGLMVVKSLGAAEQAGRRSA